MHLAVFGLNHNTAPLEIREKLFIPEDVAPLLFQEIKASGIAESVIISTCNRTEIYFCAPDCEEACEGIKHVLVERFNIQPDWLHSYSYLFTDESSFKHLFLVASGLDSMVVGEPQILGQVKDAYRTATYHGSTGFLLDKVFHRAFTVAKRVRTETKIGYNPVSISSMAVELSKKIFGDISQKKILVIGAGEMCEIALKHFRKEGLKEILLTNRTFQNAQRLSEEITGVPLPFQDIPEALVKADMVLSSTGAERPIILKDLVVATMKKRKYKPLFFIDIAVPRDIDPEANKVENVYLYDIDDLRELSQSHLSDRIKESEKAHAIVEEEVTKFISRLKQLDMNPLITLILERAEEIRNNEITKALQKLREADEDTIKGIDMLTRTIVGKLIHPHLSLIKQNGSPEILDMMKKLFKLEEQDE